MANHQSARLIAVIVGGVAGLVVACLTVTGCDNGPQQRSKIEADPAFWTDLENWRSERAATSMTSVAALQSTTTAFLASPNEENRVAWQKAWTKAHGDWLALAYLEPGFAAGYSSIDARSIDAWPITPGFIDSLPEYPHSGIVREISLEITSKVLRAQHGITDDSEVALGFHVLEYYAFERPGSDFLGDADNLERRQQLIQLIPDLIAIDLINFTSKIAYPDDFTLVELIRTLRLSNQKTFAEFNLFGEHSRFSSGSLLNTRAELATFSELLQKPELNRLLASCDPVLTTTLARTLAEAATMVETSEEINESDTSRLLLLLSAVSHQLEEFESLLGGNPG